jgi:hypothetical protein
MKLCYANSWWYSNQMYKLHSTIRFIPLLIKLMIMLNYNTWRKHVQPIFDSTVHKQSKYYPFTANIFLSPIFLNLSPLLKHNGCPVIIKKIQYSGFQSRVFKTVTLWVVTLFNVGGYQYFEATCCLHLLGEILIIRWSFWPWIWRQNVSLKHWYPSIQPIQQQCLAYFPNFEKIKVSLWDNLAVCLCVSPITTFECLNKSLWKLVCISCHMSPSQWHTS